MLSGTDNLARRYNINIKSVLWEPEVIPAERDWQSLQRLLGTHQAEWMIWEGKPDDQSVKRLQNLGLNSLVFDPCANTPEEGDFLSIMKRNIANLEKAFRADD